MTAQWPKAKLASRHQQELKRRRWWGGGALVVVVVAIVIVNFIAGGDREEEQQVGEISMAMIEARSSLDAALVMAGEALESGEAQALLEARREQEALRAEWREGESVVIAGQLQPDQSVYLALMGRNVPEAAILRVLTAIEEDFDFRRSRPGDKWRAVVNEDGSVEEFRYETSPEDVWITRRDEEGKYIVEELEIDVDVRTRKVAGRVDGSFWLSLSNLGESDLLAFRFMRVFEFTIDFNTETRDGDHFAMVFEELYFDDEFLRLGRVLAAVYIGDRGTRRAFYYESDDESGYFDEEGESMQRQFLRSPLPFTRVTSGFGRRQHPISGDQRMHRGVDYGAPVGTEVQAVASGRVTFAGWRGGYGNLLIIEHSGGYQTRYAHLSRFHVSAGSPVSQGDIVARSGNTGASTAPHLHYEMLRHGQHIDPLRVDATSGEPLSGADLQTFEEQHVQPLNDELHRALADVSTEAATALLHQESEQLEEPTDE